jgi:hypothetical protein
MWECRSRIGAGDHRTFQLRRSAWSLSRAIESETKIFRILDRDVSRLDLRDVMSIWCDLVETYSGRLLPYDEDKLPAIAGLAAVISTLRQTVSHSRPLPYLAGIWAKDMHRQLFWAPATPSRPCWRLRGKDYSLPFWTWASSKIQVTFQMALTGLRTFRPVEEDAMRRTNTLSDYFVIERLSMCLRTSGQKEPTFMAGSTARSCTFADVSQAKLASARYQRYTLPCGWQNRHQLIFALDYGPFRLDGVTLRFLLLLDEVDRRNVVNKPGFSHYGIVLEMTEGVRYRRIGVFGVKIKIQAGHGRKIAKLDGALKIEKMTLI